MFDFNHWLNRFPGTNFHELNIDWLVSAVKQLAEEIHDFEIVNQFTYEGSWDITKQYKKFAIVTVNGTEGYISLQPVPAGVDITNGEYWALIADYTAVISGLGARITALEGKVNNINTRLGVEYESIVWIGDSYTQANSLGADQNKRFSTKVSNELGLTEYNYAVGGTGYIAGTVPYTTQAANAVADFMNRGIDPTKVKYVMVMGNGNDADHSYSYNDYVTAVNAVITTTKNYFSNAKIMLIPALWRAKPAKRLMIRYTTFINDVAVTYPDRVMFFDHAWTWLQGQEDKILWQEGADVHPNVTGHTILTAHVLGCIKGNNFSDVKLYEFTPTSTHADVSDCSISILIVNNRAHFVARFKTSNNTLGGNIFEHNFNGLTLSSIFITDVPIMVNVQNQLSNTGAKVAINQVLTKTGDGVGSLYTNCYCYGGSTMFDTEHYNWVEFDIPYGIQVVDMR